MLRLAVRAVLAFALAICPLVASRAQAIPVPTPAAGRTQSGDFLRFVNKGTTGSRLETADVAFRNDAGVTVHLVAAVHVAEREYFENLNQSFKLRDAVLYEMVKPRDVLLPQPGQKLEPSNAVGHIQRFMKDMLGLEYQLDVIDYSPEHFVHADLDAETFARMQEERGESFAQMFFQALMKAMTDPAPPIATDIQDLDEILEDMVKLITRPDSQRQLKLRLARQLADFEKSPFGPDAMDGTVLLTERNKAAMKALDRALADGKRDVALFYGAAHMPDFATRLRQRGFQSVATEWRLAWDLTIRPDEPSAVEKMLMDLIRGLDDEDDD
jgi:hypothetical protein